MELSCQVAAHACRGRIRVGEFGMCLFQLLQFAHERVELEIGNLGRIVDIITMVMVFQLLAQRFDSFAYHFVPKGPTNHAHPSFPLILFIVRV